MFVFLFAIFFTSAGFLVSASLAPAPPAAIAPAATLSASGGPLVLQLSPESPGTKAHIPSTGSTAALTNAALDKRISGDAPD